MSINRPLRIPGRRFVLTKNKILESQKHTLMHELAVTQERIGGMQEKMIKEYGSADINLMNGTINWPEEDKKDEK